jgi:hypothetical protein
MAVRRQPQISQLTPANTGFGRKFRLRPFDQLAGGPDLNSGDNHSAFLIPKFSPI